MANPLFSRYSQGENRVTASILAVFERISFALVERILQSLCGDSNLSLVEIKNQIKLGKENSVPDGAIQASFAYWIETKVVQKAFEKDISQLKQHLSALKNLQETSRKKLIVLTPDLEQPKLLQTLPSELVVWASFNDLYAAIAEILDSSASLLTSDIPIVSEQERFLLRELVQMLMAERLLTSKSESVLIVPARSAIHDYRNYAAYLCQPNRSFQPVEYIGFYHNGCIDQRIAKILAPPIENVVLNEEGIEAEDISSLDDQVRARLRDLVQRTKDDRHWGYGDTVKVFLLSAAESQDTLQLKQDIRNDLRNEAGKPYAFTQSQRYVLLTALKENPATTSELLRFQSSDSGSMK